MEVYQGLKFCTQFTSEVFPADKRLDVLNRWVYVMGELGLAPVHLHGAYGNHSFRSGGNSFIITRTGMVPHRTMSVENYCLVSYERNNDVFLCQGNHQPSSECFLHLYIYEKFVGINTIMHGHSNLLNIFADPLGIAVTAQEFPYGTRELAEAATAMLSTEVSFFILKNHGFVAVGEGIADTAALVLLQYKRLVDLLAEQTPERLMALKI